MVSFLGLRPGRTGLPACCAHDSHHAHHLEWQSITVQGQAQCAVYLAALVADYLAPRVERAVVVLLLATSLQEGALGVTRVVLARNIVGTPVSRA